LQKGTDLITASRQFTAPRPALDNQAAQFARAFGIVRGAIDQLVFPGAALAVTHQGSLVAAQGFGRFTYDPGSAEVRSDTIFDLASLTKVITTTTMAMVLYERGLMSLDASLQMVLPEFVTLAPPYQRERRSRVTVRMLLAHSSGLPAYERLFEFARDRDELMRAAITTPLVMEPGTHAAYSDIGFILLGEVLARLSGSALDRFAEQEIFAPLGMERARFNPPEDWRLAIPPTEEDKTFRKRIIQGEVNDENAFVMGGISGHAGVFAPATDVARFAECMLRGGTPILNPDTVRLFTGREASPQGTSRALGWDTPSHPSSSGIMLTPSSFGHLGFTGTSLWIDPRRQLSVTLLTNRTWPHRSAQAIRQIRPVVHDAIVEALN
jgi:CubicO group peptidase (beta-lactamase class C family)